MFSKTTGWADPFAVDPDNLFGDTEARSVTTDSTPVTHTEPTTDEDVTGPGLSTDDDVAYDAPPCGGGCGNPYYSCTCPGAVSAALLIVPLDTDFDGALREHLDQAAVVHGLYADSDGFQQEDSSRIFETDPTFYDM